VKINVKSDTLTCNNNNIPKDQNYERIKPKIS
jgi:hypothetical protein